MAVHPMAFALARTLPAECALALAVYPLGAVSITGPHVPGGDHADPIEYRELLRDACRAMTYCCPMCGEQRGVSDWTRDSLGLGMCVPCLDECEAENAALDAEEVA